MKEKVVSEISLEDLSIVMGMLGNMASELHDELSENGNLTHAQKADRIAYFAWMFSRGGLGNHQV